MYYYNYDYHYVVVVVVVVGVGVRTVQPPAIIGLINLPSTIDERIYNTELL
jgi:hypothetical protein